MSPQSTNRMTWKRNTYIAESPRMDVSPVIFHCINFLYAILLRTCSFLGMKKHVQA